MLEGIVERIDKLVEGYRDEIVKIACDLIEIKAISPDVGGEGELEKAEYIEGVLERFGLDFKRYDAKDERAKGGVRPNIVARIKGESEKTIWIVSHIDVVPEGDLALWKTPPFKAVVKDGRIYGRGSEDNNQAIVSSLISARVVLDLISEGMTPKSNLGFVFVSDEETGSRYGVQHVIECGVFRDDDLVVVPDWGDDKGGLIEIAEKSILWLKFKVYGVQSHASRPHLNANRRAMEFLLELDRELHERFDGKDDIFDVPRSTFEPTRREKNVDNVNTIPGLDVSYMDCRVLPMYDLNDVIDVVNSVKERFVERDKAPIEVEVVQSNSSPPTPEDSEVVSKLKRAIEIVKGVKAKAVGIGGNTCASFFRLRGIQTAVWSTLLGNAHQPNEFCLIKNMVDDTKVFSVLGFL